MNLLSILKKYKKEDVIQMEQEGSIKSINYDLLNPSIHLYLRTLC